MPNRFRPVLACAAWLTATAALAQTAPVPATPLSPLTVQAAPSATVVEKQSHSFVQSYAAAANPEIDQIARWRDGVCVQVVGLIEADQAIRIAARVEAVAKSLKLPTQAVGCKPNIQIKFTDRPQDWLDEVAEKNEQMLGFHYHAGLKALKAVTHPIQAWYETATVGGVDNAGNSASMVFATIHGQTPPSWKFQPKQEVIDDPENGPPAGCADSPHFTACLKGVFKNVLMVADSRLAQGKDLNAVADYMAMLALSQPRSLDGCNALPSVIDLFAKTACPGRDPPAGLTPADAAYLTALYTADLAAKKAGEQDEIARRMAGILISANAAAKAR
jgi:hypothetical protein